MTVSATAKDLAGNATTQSGPTINIDTVAPNLFGLSLNDASDSGTKGDGRTNVRTPTLTFTAESGSQILIDSGNTGNYVALTSGSTAVLGTGSAQTITSPSLADGVKTINLKAVDAVGNETIRTIKLTVDTTTDAPTIASVTSIVSCRALSSPTSATTRSIVACRSVADASAGSRTSAA